MPQDLSRAVNTIKMGFCSSHTLLDSVGTILSYFQEGVRENGLQAYVDDCSGYSPASRNAAYALKALSMIFMKKLSAETQAEICALHSWLS